MTPEEKNLEGLRGWLILVGLGIVLSPVRIITSLYPIYSELFAAGSWAMLTTPGTGVYHPLWAPILIGEITINSLLILTWIFMLYLYFARKRIFPKCYIGLLLFSMAFILLDALAIRMVLPEEPVLDPDTLKELGRSAIAAAIWIPYMLKSRRVAVTFVR